MTEVNDLVNILHIVALCSHTHPGASHPLCEYLPVQDRVDSSYMYCLANGSLKLCFVIEAERPIVTLPLETGMTLKSIDRGPGRTGSVQES